MIRTGLVSVLSVESFKLTFDTILIDSDSSVYKRVPNHRVAVGMELLIRIGLVCVLSVESFELTFYIGPARRSKASVSA